MTIQPTNLKGVFIEPKGRRTQFFTENFVKGQKVYTEKLVKQDGKEYRQWIPEKSKLGAAIYNKVSQIGIKPGSKVLYIGAATGTTCSHVSDIIGAEGELYALDFAPRTQRNLVFLTETRKNMACMLEDAKMPENYCKKIPEVDVIFQDIAQRDQPGIFLKNIKFCLKSGGFGLLAVKARSIDVKKRPKDVFEEVRAQLEKEVVIVDSRTLEPYEGAHYIFIVKKR